MSTGVCWPGSYSPRRAGRQALICVKADLQHPTLKLTCGLTSPLHCWKHSPTVGVTSGLMWSIFTTECREREREKKKSLTRCFFSCSIPLSPFVASNWVSLIYSSMMLPWLSLCWPCRKISGRLSNRHCSDKTHTHTPMRAHTHTPRAPNISSEWLCQWVGSESTSRSSNPRSRAID